MLAIPYGSGAHRASLFTLACAGKHAALFVRLCVVDFAPTAFRLRWWMLGYICAVLSGIDHSASVHPTFDRQRLVEGYENLSKIR